MRLGLEVTAVGTIKPSVGDDGNYSRQLDIAAQVDTLLIQHRPHVVYIEDSYLGRNPKTFRTLLALSAMIIATCHRRRCRTVLIAPQAWRSEVEIKDKTEVKDRCHAGDITYTSGYPNSMDAAEAVLIALAGVQLEESCLA